MTTRVLPARLLLERKAGWKIHLRVRVKRPGVRFGRVVNSSHSLPPGPRPRPTSRALRAGRGSANAMAASALSTAFVAGQCNHDARLHMAYAVGRHTGSLPDRARPAAATMLSYGQWASCAGVMASRSGCRAALATGRPDDRHRAARGTWIEVSDPGAVERTALDQYVVRVRATPLGRTVDAIRRSRDGISNNRIVSMNPAGAVRQPEGKCQPLTRGPVRRTVASTWGLHLRRQRLALDRTGSARGSGCAGRADRRGRYAGSAFPCSHFAVGDYVIEVSGGGGTRRKHCCLSRHSVDEWAERGRDALKALTYLRGFVSTWVYSRNPCLT